MKYNFRHIDFLNEAMSAGSVFSGDKDEREDPSAGFYSQSSSGHGMPRGMDGGDGIYEPGDDPTNETELVRLVDWWMEALGTYEGAANTISRLMARSSMSWEDWYNFFYDMFFGQDGGFGGDGGFGDVPGQDGDRP